VQIKLLNISLFLALCFATFVGCDTRRERIVEIIPNGTNKTLEVSYTKIDSGMYVTYLSIRDNNGVVNLKRPLFIVKSPDEINKNICKWLNSKEIEISISYEKRIRIEIPEYDYINPI